MAQKRPKTAKNGPPGHRHESAVRPPGKGPSSAKNGVRRPVRGARRALGPIRRVETTKPGGWYPRQVPSDSRFGPPSPRYGRFLVSAPRRPGVAQNGAKWATAGHRGCVQASCVTQTVPHAPPMGRDAPWTRSGVPEWPSRAVLGRFGPFLGLFTPFLAVSGPPPPQCGGRRRGAAGRSGLKSGFWTGHGWGNRGPEFRAGTEAGAGARVFLLL